MLNEKKVGKTFGKILTGFIVGGAIGSILGLTLAPKKGSDTRKILRDKSLDMFLHGKTYMKEEQKLPFFKRLVLRLLKPKNTHKE